MKAVLLSIIIAISGVLLPANPARAAGAICILDSADIDIKGNLTATVKIHKSFEIYSEDGFDYAELAVPINDYIEIDDIKGYTLLPDGRKFKLRWNDIRMLSSPEAARFGGIQVALISLRFPVLGARLYYEYKLKIKSLLYLPRFERDPSCFTNRFTIRVRWDNRVKLNFDSSGLESESADNIRIFHADNLPDLPAEPNSCPDSVYLYLSSETFIYNGIEYDCRSWFDVARFFAGLSSDTETSLSEAGDLAAIVVDDSHDHADSLDSIFRFVADSVIYYALEIGKGDFSPHKCDDIIWRGFGDCKDQAVLISAMYRSIGIESYPALISTYGHPDVRDLHPWPGFFDHAVAVIRDNGREFILDPSDQSSTFAFAPLRLRGRSYLATDGYSGLRVVPDGPDPDALISWCFDLSGKSDSTLIVDLNIVLANDAAGKYNTLFRDNNRNVLADETGMFLRESGWKFSSEDFIVRKNSADSLIIGGYFTIAAGDYDNSRGVSLGSPLVAFLLDEIFTDVRDGTYCGPASISLEETVRIPGASGNMIDAPEYRDNWVRENFEFLDEMSFDLDNAVFHRRYLFSGGIIPADDYNAFRDFILSRRNQRHVFISK